MLGRDESLAKYGRQISKSESSACKTNKEVHSILKNLHYNISWGCLGTLQS